MTNGRDLLYSAQQIWDCSRGSDSATCAYGLYLDDLLMNVPMHSLVPDSVSPYTSIDFQTDANGMHAPKNLA